jgi:catechol 2,3-dioxygenase-like lactoylglutathione lyase family enzyme
VASDSFKTFRGAATYGGGMTPRIDCVGLVAADMSRTLAFYRRLGLDVPEAADGEPHVEVALPGGMRLLFDTEETVRSFDASWTPPAGGGHRMGLAFACDSPADVDKVYADLTAPGAGGEGHLAPFDAVWGQRYASVRDPDGNPVDLFAGLS